MFVERVSALLGPVTLLIACCPGWRHAVVHSEQSYLQIGGLE